MKVTGIVDKWDTEKKTCKNRNFSLLKPRTHKHHEGEREIGEYQNFAELNSSFLIASLLALATPTKNTNPLEP